MRRAGFEHLESPGPSICAVRFRFWVQGLGFRDLFEVAGILGLGLAYANCRHEGWGLGFRVLGFSSFRIVY